ncbi:hypothetical protein [Maribacter litoralis]|uniref:hypothetical protein n=1 Tax=Maribacter litoralis TaxID=2059726 RepID=UPI003D290D6A
MKIKILLIVLTTTVFFNAQSQEYFEGEVHFKTKYEPLIENVPEELLVQEFGDTLIGYVQEKRYLMKSNTSGATGDQTLIMMMDENLIYYVQEKSDTIFRYPINKVEEELLDIHKIQDETKIVLGDVCPAVILNTKNNDSESPFTVSLGKYYYNPKYKLNKKAYENHKSGHWNLFVNESGAISVRNEVRHEPIYKSIMEAFLILPKEIPDVLFDINLYDKIIIDLK